MIEYLDIGKVINTHGVKGEVKVLPLTDNPERYDLLKHLFLDRDGTLKEYNVEWVKYHKGFVLLKLKGIDNLNHAEEVKNCILKVHRSQAVELPEGSYFICDLIGIIVYDLEGKELGSLRDVLQTGSNDVYVVSKDGSDILIPALKTVVKDIDLEHRRILVDLPEGIL